MMAYTDEPKASAGDPGKGDARGRGAAWARRGDVGTLGIAGGAVKPFIGHVASKEARSRELSQ